MKNKNENIQNFLDFDFFEYKEPPLTQTKKGDQIEVQLFDIIDEYSENQVISFLNDNTDKPFELLVNSNGGSAFAATSISAMIKRHEGRTVATGVSMVASAATIVLLAADWVRLDSQALFMIHNAWNPYAAGNAKELREDAAFLELIDNQILNEYTAKALKNKGGEVESVKANIKKLMAKESYLTAKEALELGLIDEIVEGLEAKETLDKQTIGTLNKVLKRTDIPNHARKLILNKIGMSKDNEPTSMIDKVLNYIKGNPTKALEITNAIEKENDTKVEDAKKLLEDSGFTVAKAEDLEAKEQAASDEKEVLANETKDLEEKTVELEATLASKDKEILAFSERLKSIEDKVGAGVTASLEKETKPKTLAEIILEKSKQQ